ncbi:MAG: type II toxin-antitoxin system HicB family antitoxin, partial [Gemmatimonadetes bacterium]|nr:type II toxin-antitoxin system HicB family antitoxin [Gemmatimonadota bacterium]
MNDTIRNRSMGAALPSGRFVMRIDPALHAALRDAARAAGLSLNDYCVRKLAAPGSPVGPAEEVLKRAASLLGAGLVG